MKQGQGSLVLGGVCLAETKKERKKIKGVRGRNHVSGTRHGWGGVTCLAPEGGNWAG